ncbi:MAG: hypothetical protein ACF8R7_06145, partial [Phycisphaerales bacterium JB039]
MSEQSQPARPQQPEQPTDLLAARAGAARPKGFFDWPSVRKFRRNRLAIVALGVIAIYFITALLVILPVGVFSGNMNEVTQRVAGSGLPGLGASASREVRVEQVDFYLSGIEKALEASDPASALDILHFAERDLADWDVERFEEELDTAWGLFDDYDDALAEYDDLIIESDQLAREARALGQADDDREGGPGP